VPNIYSKKRLNINLLKHLSYRLVIPLIELKHIAENVEPLYKFYKEPKKNGGFRGISNPTPRLKKIQKAIHKLLTEIKISDSAHGGIKGRSNLTNAQCHCNQRFLLNLDFKNFFPSISHYKVYELFHKTLGCSSEVAKVLTRLTTVRGQVPQGGSMSTDIANLVMGEIDKRLEGLSKKYDINYTRFVDDMSFSGKTIPDKFISTAKQIISQSSFDLNSEKEHLSDGSMPKVITGLSVNRKKPTVPRHVKRAIRKEAYLFSKYESNNLSAADKMSREKQIQGKLSYVNYITEIK